MDRKNNLSPYRVPENFNPFSTADTARALTDAVHHLVTEGKMVERPSPKYALGSLQSLVELLQPQVHVLQEYLREIENSTTLRLPMSDEDFAAISVEKNCVKEPAAVYVVR